MSHGCGVCSSNFNPSDLSPKVPSDDEVPPDETRRDAATSVRPTFFNELSQEDEAAMDLSLAKYQATIHDSSSSRRVTRDALQKPNVAGHIAHVNRMTLKEANHHGRDTLRVLKFPQVLPRECCSSL